jgi:hypothetical protein
MKEINISNHPNYKFILKNRILSPYGYNPFFHIKNDVGNYWTGSIYKSERQYRWTYSYMTAFDDARNNNGRVYLETTAGDLILNEKDFQ